MKFPVAAIALTVLIMMSCRSSRGTHKENQNFDPKEMIDKGFLQGEIVHSDIEGNCEYTIKTIDEPIEFLDPFNLSKEFQVDGMLIWFKYTGLREQNRCEKARPIEIVEIFKRSA